MSATAYGARGFCYAELGDYQQAIKDYIQAIKIDPKNGGTYYNLGLAYAKVGNYQQAINNLKIAAGLGLKPAQELLIKIRSVAPNILE